MRFIVTAPVKGGYAWWNVADTESPVMENFAVVQISKLVPDAGRIAHDLADKFNRLDAEGKFGEKRDYAQRT